MTFRKSGAARLAVILSAVWVLASGKAAAAVGPEDLLRIRELTEAGDYAVALEQHLAFHEASANAPGMAAVRLSFALIDWLSLAERYPPARDALVTLKDNDKALLLAGEGDLTHFRDFAAINQALELQEESVEVFLSLEERFPAQATIYYLVLEDQLFEREDYEVIARHIGDPLRKYETLRYTRDLAVRGAGPDSPLREALDRRFVSGVRNLLRFLVAQERREEALDIQQRALAYYPHEDISAAVP